jgi:hypothetical protein
MIKSILGRISLLVLGVSPLAACAHDSAPSEGMMMTTTIEIENSGATNLIGWRIQVGQYGAASWESGDGSGHAMLPAAIGAKLEQDLARAKPLANLPSGGCAKSASFGTSTFVAVGGDKSPDLSCPGSDAGRALAGDIATIASYLSVRNVTRSRGHELPPENF